MMDKKTPLLSSRASVIYGKAVRGEEKEKKRRETSPKKNRAAFVCLFSRLERYDIGHALSRPKHCHGPIFRPAGERLTHKHTHKNRVLRGK